MDRRIVLRGRFQLYVDSCPRRGPRRGGLSRRHDSYTVFSVTGDLLKTGLTGTNVMDVRVVLIGAQS